MELPAGHNTARICSTPKITALAITIPKWLKEGQCHQAHDGGLDVQLARKDGHVERHEGLGGQGPQLHEHRMHACSSDIKTRGGA
eukprot:123107-Pelagomonas_calceolata.AAC.1